MTSYARACWLRQPTAALPLAWGRLTVIRELMRPMYRRARMNMCCYVLALRASRSVERRPTQGDPRRDWHMKPRSSHTGTAPSEPDCRRLACVS